MNWKKPNEVTEPGLYVFIFYGQNLQIPGFSEINLDKDTNKLYLVRKNKLFQENWPTNYRFIGPLPPCKE